LFFFVFQSWIYLKGPGFSWSKWGAALSLATAVYSSAVFVQFNSYPNWINHFSEIVQYSTFVIIVHSVYGFTFSYLKINRKRYHLIAGIFHTVLLIVLWSTHLVITDGYVYRSFLWLKEPYIEPELGILGPFFLMYTALAAAYSLTYWVRYRHQKIGAKKAVEYLRNNAIDLVVLDMIMEPGIDGLETYKKILEFKPGQKAIIASGFSETERVKEALQLGAGAYVKKPYTIEKIGKAVSAELAGSGEL
jgi:CheY-like chemotaxis protein